MGLQFKPPVLEVDAPPDVPPPVGTGAGVVLAAPVHVQWLSGHLKAGF